MVPRHLAAMVKSRLILLLVYKFIIVMLHCLLYVLPPLDKGPSCSFHHHTFTYHLFPLEVLRCLVSSVLAAKDTKYTDLQWFKCFPNTVRFMLKELKFDDYSLSSTFLKSPTTITTMSIVHMLSRDIMTSLTNYLIYDIIIIKQSVCFPQCQWLS